MRAPSLALIALLVLAVPALSVDVIELKDGRILEVKAVSVKGDQVVVELNLADKTKRIAYSMPIGKVVPEFVYYAWLEQIDPANLDEYRRLAQWCRDEGLFRHARRTYKLAAEFSETMQSELEGLEAKMHEEEATWNFAEGERLFREGDVKSARVRIERVLKDFADTNEVGRAKELLSILAEREQFLSEQKKQEEIASRARRQRRLVDKQLARIDRADRYADRARLGRSPYAKHRLRWAAYAYRTAAQEFADLLPAVEVDDLRLMLRALLDDLRDRMVLTFNRLADVSYVMGDTGTALDAVHEVLALDPGNKAASGLRDRILDGGRGPATVADDRVRYPLGGIRYRYPFYSPYRYYSRRVIKLGITYPVYGAPLGHGFGVSSVRLIRGFDGYCYR